MARKPKTDGEQIRVATEGPSVGADQLIDFALERNAILCKLNPAFAAMMPERVMSVAGDTPDMFREAAE